MKSIMHFRNAKFKNIMKKLLTVLFVASLATAFTSCKKDFVCECTLDGQKTETPINDSKKSDAQNACDALDVTAKGAGALIGDANAGCSLK
jgi:predicted SprT family Zn-dependent metalloprotease